MFAVREEVELLKEQIRNLIARNERLEYENNFLRSRSNSAAPDQLQPGPAAASIPTVENNWANAQLARSFLIQHDPTATWEERCRKLLPVRETGCV